MRSEQEVQDFLEHFGVKGQKWGIRKVKQTNDKLARGHLRRTARVGKALQNPKTRKALGSVGRVGAGAAISAGTIFAVQWLLTKGPSKVSQLVVPDAEHVFYGRGDKWVAKRK